MNLYRSFGNLMEAWMNDGSLYSDSESLGNNDEGSPTPSSDMGTNLRSESVDSGVETASSDTSFAATSCFASADIDAFTPEREGDGLTPASTSQSPVLSSPVLSSSSSSSPHLCPSRAQVGSPALHLKVEQALQRTDSKLQKNNPGPLTVEEVLRRRPRASPLPKRHTSELVRGQRSGSFGPRRTANPVPVRQMSDMCRRPVSLSYDKQRSEGLGEEEQKELSPGLSYLQEVCQMLEDIAKQKMHNRALQAEMDALREHPDTQVKQAADTCQSDSKAAEENLSSCLERLENTDNSEHNTSEPQQQKNKPYGHFRQRSASDTTIAALHLRKMSSDCRGQHLSTDDLLEKIEEEREKEKPKKEESSKSYKTWKLKISSLRGLESLRDTKGQQTQSSEKNSARRRLSQLFRKRRKTLPI
ncbi:uncharacterized protein LOC108879277 isoform X1 [Lates japonicus]